MARQKSSEALYRRLPPGAHGLPRETVEQNQRARLHGAMVTAVARDGYAQATVAQIVKLAGVSLTAFYKHFDGKEDCFVATHDLVAEAGVERVSAAYRSAGDWRERLHAAFTAFVDLVTEEPDAAKLVIVDALAAGPRALERREVYTEAFEQMVRQSFDQAPEPAEVSDATIRAIVGGVRRVVYHHLRHGRAEQLPEVVDDLFEWALQYREPGVEPPRDPTRSSRRRPDKGAYTTLAKPDPLRDRLRLNHRERIIKAVASIAYEKGYRSLTIPEITATAGISNQTFYEQFADKEEAFLATIDDGAMRALTTAAESISTAESWEEGVRLGIDALLTFLVSEPTLARLGLLHVLSAGDAAVDRVDLVHESFGAFLGPGFELRPETPPIVAHAIAGGIWGVLDREIAHDRIAELPALTPSITYIALAPFLGAGRAAEVARDAP